jgi:hypothetical protein
VYASAQPVQLGRILNIDCGCNSRHLIYKGAWIDRTAAPPMALSSAYRREVTDNAWT